MTSFERPDSGLLVEHLLPSLLGMRHSLSQENQDRNMFFVELGKMLESHHGRLTVIYSPTHTNREESQYPWLWRYVSHFTVGAQSHAVQHAKLWAFHWWINHEDYLELNVSSTNLTTSAFKSQVQAGWQVLLMIDKSGSSPKKIQQTWGKLIPFLKSLGASAGKVAEKRIARLVALLGRVKCPADVTFVASIPGQKSAAHQLRKLEPSEIHLLTPTIGEWTDKRLSEWSRDVGINTSQIHLKWITEEHPWSASNGWTMSTTASQALTTKQVQLDCLPNDSRFTNEHQDGDNRWSHAKLYLIRGKRKKERRLLITSANWSPSAWGAGGLKPHNFELGVIIETDWADLETIGKPFGKGINPFCFEKERCKPDTFMLQWSEASWDGKQISLYTRSTDPDTQITAIVNFTGGKEKTIHLAKGRATIPWKDPKHTPLTARFKQGAEAMEVDVLDLRPPSEFAKTPPPEVDPSVAAALREAFLLQRYGGRVVVGGKTKPPGTKPPGTRPPGVSAPAADYSVQAWIEARDAFKVIDKWRNALAEARTDPDFFERVRLDGEELRSIYSRREGPAAELAVEELGWRIKEEL